MRLASAIGASTNRDRDSTVTQAQLPPDDDLPTEVDLSNATRGKFDPASAKVHVPACLDDQLQAQLAELASAKGIDLTVLVNDLLRRNLELAEKVQPLGVGKPLACGRETTPPKLTRR